MKNLFAVLMLSTVVGMAGAQAADATDESQIPLKQGPGVDVVRRNCAICHSVDYIVMNSPFLDRKGWEGEVDKMINAMHAPISKNDVPTIVDYLTKYYGVPSSPTPPASTTMAR